MTSTLMAVPTPPLDAAVVESVLLHGDLSKLTPAQRVVYYNRVCDSLGLNPLTKPFEYLTLSGKLILYARRDATEQLRKLHGVSIVEISSREVGGVFVVTAKAQDARQRIDVSTGAVPTANLKGEALANALMKAETKAKRRVTLSICGLGVLDESEVESIPQAAVQAAATVEVPSAVPEPEAPATELDPNLVYVTKVVKDKEAGAWEISTSDGKTYTTKSKIFSSRAQSIRQYKQAVEIELGDDGEITELRRNGPAADDALPV